MKNIYLTLLIALFAQLSLAKEPNFIIIYADDLGYADTSVQMMDNDPSTKSEFIQTPGLERLADMGARFTAAYAPTPTCTGSRISIQLGQSSARVQYRNVNDVYAKVQRPQGWDDEVTMAEMLKASGKNYITAMFGKGCSAMGRYDEAGYDITDEMPGHTGGNGNGHGQWWDPYKKIPFPEDDPKRLHSLRKDSVAFINEYAGTQPFFMMVAHYAAHIPHKCTEEAFERNRKRLRKQGSDIKENDITYAAMVEEMDMNVGAIIDALKAKGELDNTYIIFTSDNGGGHSQKRQVDGENRRYNGPLQEGKRSIYEGGIRVPTVISGPGIKAGSECDVPIAQWDFLATFHDLSGSTAPLPENVDGGSLRDVFENGNAGKVERVAPGILHHYTCHYHPPISSIIIGDYKLMRHLNSGEIKLFNIKTDYGEENDLSKKMPEKVASMDATRQEYVDEVDGGSAEQVRQALFKQLEQDAVKIKAACNKKLAGLQESNPPDLEEQKAKLLKEANFKLRKQAITRERAKLHAELFTWRHYVDKNLAEQRADESFVEWTGDA